MGRWFTLAYLLAVGALGLANLWPRLSTQFAPTQVVRPPSEAAARDAQGESPGALNSQSALQSGPAAPDVARVSLNSASLAEIESLPGVGPALAQRILEGRPYARVEDLDRVKGIGPKLLERLRPLVGP